MPGDLVNDLLRWDWCKIAPSHYYPAFLDLDLNSRAKHIGSEVIKQNKEKYAQLYNSADFKSAVYFSPLTKEFSNNVMKKNELAVFIKKKKNLKEIIYIKKTLE